jgi:hypothetical protein
MTNVIAFESKQNTKQSHKVKSDDTIGKENPWEISKP